METLAVIDFETNGMSPDQGARATEVGVVLVRDGKIIDRYQSLMNTGAYIPQFIESLTGISNAMVSKAPPAARVMREVADFVGTTPLVAHNASFDQKFWDAELARIDRGRTQPFACSLLLSRRILPQALSHKLSSLVDYLGIPVAGQFHRALADAEMTAHLVTRILETIKREFDLEVVSHELLLRIQSSKRRRVRECVDAFSEASAT